MKDRHELISNVEKLKDKLRYSNLNSYQIDYISTSLTSLIALIESLDQVSNEVSSCLVKLLHHFENLITPRSNLNTSFHTPNKSTRKSFDSPIRSMSRSSLVSKPIITRENVNGEPMTRELVNFLNFATPGLNQQFKQHINKRKDTSPIRFEIDTSKSFDPDNVSLN